MLKSRSHKPRHLQRKGHLVVGHHALLRSCDNLALSKVISKQPKHQVAGFTLIEMLIVVIILGITAALAVPFLSQTNSTRLVGAANMLAADLAFTQIESLSHPDQLRYLAIDQTSNSYRIIYFDNAATPNEIIVNNPVGNVPYRTEYGKGRAAILAGVTIQSYQLGGDNLLKFGIYGELDQTTVATITLAAGNMTIMISIDPFSGEAIIDGVN